MSDIYQDITSNEWFFPADGYILSETDSNGIILYVNELFCDIAGYTKEELIGEPHNIVRHPDMPSIALRGCGMTCKIKGFGQALLKIAVKIMDIIGYMLLPCEKSTPMEQ